MIAAPLEIGTVARELGVAPSTLRSWERRYRMVVPRRGANGQRLYDSEQVVVLRQILDQVRMGVRARAAHLAAGLPATVGTACCTLAPGTEATGLARREVDRALEGTELQDDERFAFNLRLIASELVKNAVVHGDGASPIELEIELYLDGAELCIHNPGARIEIRSLRAHSEIGGHGFEIVDALSDSWTIETGPNGTRVKVHLTASTHAATEPSGAAMFAASAMG